MAAMIAHNDTPELDDIDHKLIGMLRNDARCPAATLAKTLGISRATVRSRIGRLRESGVISGFTIAVREPGNRKLIRAITLVAVEGNRVERVLRQLHGFPQVRRLHTTNGRWDVVAELVTDTLQEFDTLLNKIRAIEGVSATESNILLSSPKSLP